MSPPASPFLRRAMLYVPASSPKMLAKSLGLNCDTIVYDLEDSVAPAVKTDARKALQAHMNSLIKKPPGVSEIAVRINSSRSSHFEEDLKLVASLHLVDTIVVPKVSTIADVRDVSNGVKRKENQIMREKPLLIMALIESARAVMNLATICEGPRLNGLIFAAEDFAFDLSLTRTPDLKEFLYARSAIVTAARAKRIPNIIDLVCTSFQGDRGLAQLKKECIDGRSMGFNGKQCIHPEQIETVQRLFTPSDEEVEWAVRVVIGDKKVKKAKRGAWALDGKMIDAPVASRAKEIVENARRCGIDVDALEEKWIDQEPE